MILGTYWFFKFPTGLYEFDYFEFLEGRGGFAGSPAELITSIITENSEKIILDLKSLIETYDEGSLFIRQEKNKLNISTGGWQLFDYDFLFITEVEKILRKENVRLAKETKLDSPILKLQNNNFTNKNIQPKKNFLQIVGSELKKNNAENSKFRLDCNLSKINKSHFIADLKTISKEENIRVFFYQEKDCGDKTNLMLFFTNGRQGLNLEKKQIVNSVNFENKVEELMLQNNVNIGFIQGFENYPKNESNVEMMIEKEWII